MNPPPKKNSGMWKKEKKGDMWNNNFMLIKKLVRVKSLITNHIFLNESVKLAFQAFFWWGLQYFLLTKL